MADNQLFADWVTGDLITAAKLNQMKNDLVPWLQVGQANGVAALDGNRDLAALKVVRASIPANGQVSLTNADGLIGKGAIFIVTDGNSSPGHVILQIYRNGTYNEAVASANINWAVGGTSDPGTGAFRVWVDGQAADAPLILKSTVSYGRGVRILQFPVTL